MDSSLETKLRSPAKNTHWYCRELHQCSRIKHLVIIKHTTKWIASYKTPLKWRYYDKLNENRKSIGLATVQEYVLDAFGEKIYEQVFGTSP